MLVLRIFLPCYHGNMCDAVRPLAWVGPEDGTNSNEGRLGLPAPFMEAYDPDSHPAKKQATRSFFP